MMTSAAVTPASAIQAAHQSATHHATQGHVHHSHLNGHPAGVNGQSNAPPSTHQVPPTAALLTTGTTGPPLNAPRYGTTVPNRIFVGGITTDTNECDLESLFARFGTVSAVKIINDRAGVPRG